MKLEKWKTSVVGVGPWIVSDNDDPLGQSLGVFRQEEDADIFLAAKNASQPSDSADGATERSNADYCPMCDSFDCICGGC